MADIPRWCVNYTGNMTIYLVHYYCSKIEVNLSTCKPLQSHSDMEDIRTLCEASEIIWYAAFWFSVVLGIVGNTLALWTIASLPVSIVTFYIGLLAFSDLFALIIRTAIYFLNKEDLINPNTPYWHIFPLLFDFSVSYSNWLLVLICLDRFFIIRYPLLRRVYFTIRYARITTFTLAVVLFSIYLVAVQVFSYKDTRMFTVRNLLYSLIPFIFILILIALIAIQFRTIHRKRKLLQGGSFSPNTSNPGCSSFRYTDRNKSGYSDSPGTSLRTNGHCRQSQNSNQAPRSRPNVFEDIERLENNITIMMMVTAISFAILTIPNCVLLFTFQYATDHWNTPLGRARWHVFSKTSQALTFLNLSMNFLLYFLSANKFRHQLCVLLRIRRKGNNNRNSKTNAPLQHNTSLLQLQNASETYL